MGIKRTLCLYGLSTSRSDHVSAVNPKICRFVAIRGCRGRSEILIYIAVTLSNVVLIDSYLSIVKKGFDCLRDRFFITRKQYVLFSIQFLETYGTISQKYH